MQEADSHSVTLHLEVESCCPVHIGVPIDVVIMLDQKGNKRDKIGKEKGQIIPFHRWYDSIHKISQKFYQKTSGNDQHFYLITRVQINL